MKAMTITSGIKDYLISYENGVVTVKVRHCTGTIQNVRKPEVIERMMRLMNEEAIDSGKLRDEALAMNEETDRRRADAVRRSLLVTLEESGTLSALVEACHAEALEENNRFDWLRARFGVFHVSLDAIKQQIVEEAHEEALRMNFTTLCGDELVEGMQLHRRDGSLGTIKRLRYPTDNTVEILEGGKWREFYRHNTFEVLR